jgi:hypothetical protein
LAKEVAALEKKKEKKMQAQECHNQIKQHRNAKLQQNIATTKNSDPASGGGVKHDSKEGLLMQGKPEVWKPELDSSSGVIMEEEK